MLIQGLCWSGGDDGAAGDMADECGVGDDRVAAAERTERRAEGGRPAGDLRDCAPAQGAPLGGGRKRGAYAQGLGISRGGRTSKVHGLTDGKGRPRVLLISPGHVHDATMAPALIAAAHGRFTALLADRGYDSNAIRAAVQAQGAEVVIPPTAAARRPNIKAVQCLVGDHPIASCGLGLVKKFVRAFQRYRKQVGGGR